jgi:uncharacterized protein YdaU (DUF1376 family)
VRGVKRLPYFKMYPADADTDENFRLMSFEERGLYWTLLNHCWLNDGLPDSPADIRGLFRVPQKDFDRIWPRVSKCFDVVDGRLRNRRQEKERKEAREKCLKASKSSAFSSERNQPGFIYLIRRDSDRAVKIGSALDVPRRLAQLKYKHRSDDYGSLSLVFSGSVSDMGGSEVKIHRLYDSRRVNGEWFSLSEEEIAQITLYITPKGDMRGDGGDHPRLRASASVSESAFVSEDSKKNQEREFSFDFSDWFERQYARHPKKKNRIQAEQAAVSAFSASEFTLEEFEKKHIAWCSSEEWSWKAGARAPELGAWITDKGFRYEPPEPKAAEDSWQERVLRAGLRRKKYSTSCNGWPD